ncbi:DivIVA domain-containing protein, partial [Bifidobacterium stellenboschense]
MAQQSEAGIPRAGKRKWGYDPAQVDAFLERAHALYDSDGAQLTQRDIQNVSFDLTRGGYEIAQVDAALARLERAVVDKQTTWEISQHGRVAWKAKTEELYREIAKHLDRGERERFGSGKPRTPSYDRKQVDKLADQIADKAAAELGLDGVSKKDVRDLDKITADFVSNSVFTQRKGKKGYDERQVDYFLNTCVQLLSRIESFDRVADYVTSDGEGAHDAASAVAPAAAPASVDGIAPLFSPDAQYQRPAAPQSDGADAP